ncbi:hypothetical protein N2152v2_001938 [Parachlorella kessleri]
MSATTEELRQACQMLQLDPCQTLTPELVRKQYLKLALRLHPDRNPAPDAAEAFRNLGEAYELALASVAQGAAAQLEKRQTEALLSVFFRALRGEDVRAELGRMGVHQPPSDFGVDLNSPFDARVELDGDEGGAADVAAAFRDIFQEEGLTEEGDPVDGYAFPLGEEI